MNYDEPLDVQKVRVDKIDLVYSMMVDRGSWEVRKDDSRFAIIQQLRTYVIGLPEERIRIDRKYPTDWWQAVKERWFPRAWLRRWPVQYAHVSIDRQLYKAVCPHLTVPPGNRCVEWLYYQSQRP